METAAVVLEDSVVMIPAEVTTVTPSEVVATVAAEVSAPVVVATVTLVAAEFSAPVVTVVVAEDSAPVVAPVEAEVAVVEAASVTPVVDGELETVTTEDSEVVSEAVNGQYVVYSVMVPSMVVVATETKAAEVVKEHLFSSQEVMVTKVVVSEET